MMPTVETKPTNPKNAVGSDKPPLHLWPMTATAMGSLALLDGALKYGRTNWRHAGVRATIYTDALARHMGAWLEGEDADPDSGLPHLGHALACIAIIIDAQAAGKLTDDRMFPGGHRGLMDHLAPHVARLKAKHAGKDPFHYTATSGVPVDPSSRPSAVDSAHCVASSGALDACGFGMDAPRSDSFPTPPPMPDCAYCGGAHDPASCTRSACPYHLRDLPRLVPRT